MKEEIRRWFAIIAQKDMFAQGVWARLLRALREQANTIVGVNSVKEELRQAIASQDCIAVQTKLNFLKARQHACPIMEEAEGLLDKDFCFPSIRPHGNAAYKP